jgi:anti-anti-sigma regulatory factor
MKLRTSERVRDDVLILELRGTITPGPSEIALWDTMTEVLGRGYRKVVVDVSKACSTSPAAVSALLGALHLARSAGGDVKLLGVVDGFDDLRIIVALCDHFDVFDREEQAVRSFGPVLSATRHHAEAPRPFSATPEPA